MQAFLTASQIFTNNPIFELLPSSVVKPNCSWRNIDQRYDVKCLYCHAIHSDHIKTNNIAPSKRPMKMLYNLLTCNNCGMFYDDQNHLVAERPNKKTPYHVYEFPFNDYQDIEEYEYFSDNQPELKDHGILCGNAFDISIYNIKQPTPVKRQQTESDLRRAESRDARVVRLNEIYNRGQERRQKEFIHRNMEIIKRELISKGEIDDDWDWSTLDEEEIGKHLHARYIKLHEQSVLAKRKPIVLRDDEWMPLPMNEIPKHLQWTLKREDTLE